ncbi:integrin alpha-11-like, partial [Paramuricea clavata]
RREYIYFGASVCAVDVNDDGYDDLIVGAPFYSGKGGDEGRVYIYLSSEIQSIPGRRVLTLSSGENSLDPGLRGSNTKGARFGWSLAKTGDLNNDKIQDFIVGAPQDQPDLNNDGFGNGAIYIYHGRRDGKFDKYQQVCLLYTTEHDIHDKVGCIPTPVIRRISLVEKS